MHKLVMIVLLTLLAAVVVMPRAVNIGPLSLYRPHIDLRVGDWRIFRDLDLKLGLDLQGGTHLVYEADVSQVEPENIIPAIEATRNNIDRRINLLGVTEPLIQTSQVGDKHRLIVELAGITDINTALATIGQTALLEFKASIPDTDSAQPDQIKPEIDFAPTNLTGKDLKLAQVQFNNGKAVVSLDFTPDGAQKFSQLTRENLGKPLAIFLDGMMISAPIVEAVITDGRAIISGDFTLEDAKRLSVMLNAGALPLPITIVEQRNVGATLGQESIDKSLVAAVIGLLSVWTFMIGVYGLKGLLANIALAVYTVLVLAIIKLVPVTLTLSGIAGLVLSVGMAVDANILTFERIKEELRWGRSKKVALNLGFIRAWNSIRDSNISSLITAGILFWFGSGPVRGFALTLTIGILVSLFTSLTVTRSLLRLVYERD